MATVMGPFEGDNVHEAMADSMTKTGVADAVVTVQGVRGHDDAWIAAATMPGGGSARAVLLKSSEGWLVALGDGTEDDAALLTLTRAAVAQFRAQREADAAKSPNPGEAQS